MKDNIRLHHFAIVLENIEKSLKFYEKVYNAVPVGSIFYDNSQLVKVQFIKSNELMIELLEPVNDDSPVKKFLDNHGSGRLYHIAFEVDDLDATAIKVREDNGLIISRSKNGWNGMEVMFAMFIDENNENQLVEYVTTK